MAEAADGAPGGSRTITVHAEPQNATVLLRGEPIPVGEPTPIEFGDSSSASVTVESPGYGSKTIELLRADSKSHVVKVRLERQ
jgi:hypothetical protein